VPSIALVICNGKPPSIRLARRLARGCDVIIAADGGANFAHRCRLRPDVIIGDLDSIKPATQRYFSSSRVVRVASQYSTDLEKALDYLRRGRVKQALIIGATGKRIDFTLGNLSIIWNYVGSMSLVVAGDGWYAIPVKRELRVSASRGTTVSLLPFGQCSGITLRGFKYPLTNSTMKVGEIGVSNLATASSSHVKVRRGNMLVIVMEEYIPPRVD
jgi:thiamine pyrophosphokinase